MTYQTVFLRAACTCVCAREGGWNLDNTTEEDACHVSCDEEDACHVSYEEEDACHVSYEEEDAYLQQASEGTNGHAQQADKKKYHKKNIIIPAASIRRNKSSCAASGSPSSGPQHTPNKFSTISVLVQFFSKIRVLVYPVSIQCMCV